MRKFLATAALLPALAVAACGSTHTTVHHVIVNRNVRHPHHVTRHVVVHHVVTHHITVTHSKH